MGWFRIQTGMPEFSKIVMTFGQGGVNRMIISNFVHFLRFFFYCCELLRDQKYCEITESSSFSTDSERFNGYPAFLCAQDEFGCPFQLKNKSYEEEKGLLNK